MPDIVLELLISSFSFLTLSEAPEREVPRRGDKINLIITPNATITSKRLKNGAIMEFWYIVDKMLNAFCTLRDNQSKKVVNIYVLPNTLYTTTIPIPRIIIVVTVAGSHIR